jgi:hypothetical protein
VAYREKGIAFIQLTGTRAIVSFYKMPLIILSGYPSSGKTQRVNEIKEYFVRRLEEENKSLRIHVINDESLHVPKDAYKGIMSFQKLLDKASYHSCYRCQRRKES